MSDDTVTSLAGGESYCPECSRSYAEGVETCPDDGSKLVRFKAQVDPLIGRVLDGRFEVRARIGRGGMGTVYRAWQRSVEREVAIKVVDPRLAHDRTAAKRFLREARLGSRLNQANIVDVYDFGQTDDDVLFLAMELLRGRTLAQRLADHEPITVRRALGIGAQLCDALVAAHGQGIVHRDLKPQNIVVLDDPPGRDVIKVLDFGLAKSLIGDGTTITRDDALLGTPLYMAPEVIQGQPAEPPSDLYSLGCILYELLCGAPPFREATANAVLARHLSEKPRPLPEVVPAEVRDLVARLLEKDPARRPASAEVVRDAIARVLGAGGGLEVSARRKRETSPAALAETVSETPEAAAIAVAETAFGDGMSTSGYPKYWGVAVVAVTLVLAAVAWVVWPRGGKQAAATVDAGAVDAGTTPAVVVPVDAAPAAAPMVIDAAPEPAPAPAIDAKGKAPPRPRRPRESGTGTGTGSGGTATEPDVDFLPVD